MDAEEDGIDAEPSRDGKRWRWVWSSPWGAQHTAPARWQTRDAALVAGREWLARMDAQAHQRITHDDE